MKHTVLHPIYETGLHAIDDEHKLLLIHIEELAYLLKKEHPETDELLNCCNRLFTAVRSHYDHEEKLMLKHFFPDTEAHIGQHMQFLIMIGKLIQLIKDKEYPSALSNLEFLMKWKWEHIKDADKKYADFIQTKPA